MNNHNTKIEKYQGKIPRRKKFKYSKILQCGKVIDAVYMTWEPKAYVKRLKGREYVNLKTGEVREYMPKQDGVQMRNRRSLRKIFVDLRQLITTNYEGGQSEKFLTLTYREQTNDPKKIYKDLDIFNKRLKRAYPAIAYIHIVEPHASGNYHVHSLLKLTDGEAFDMTYDKAYKLWGQGFVKVENLIDVDNIGAYFVAYFSNMEITDSDVEKYPDDIIEKNGKKYIKGKRLDYYPDHMQIHRDSRNLKKPRKIEEIPKTHNKTYEVKYKLTYTDEYGNTEESYLEKEQWKKADRGV